MTTAPVVKLVRAANRRTYDGSKPKVRGFACDAEKLGFNAVQKQFVHEKVAAGVAVIASSGNAASRTPCAAARCSAAIIASALAFGSASTTFGEHAATLMNPSFIFFSAAATGSASGSDLSIF